MKARAVSGPALSAVRGGLLRVGRRLAEGVPPLDERGLGRFRIALGIALLMTLGVYWPSYHAPFTEDAGRPYPPAFPRELHGDFSPLADQLWVHWLAEDDEARNVVRASTLVAIAAFTLGLAPRLSYLASVAGIGVHVLLVLQLRGAHDWGVPLVALTGLLAVPWHESGLRPRRRGVSSIPSRERGFAVWLPSWALGVAYAAAGVAKLRESGLDWVTSGAVRYHFVTDAAYAPFDLGSRLAVHDTLPVALSAAALLLELTFGVVVLFPQWWVRFAFGVAAAGLLAGFLVFQGVFWMPWWILLLAFLPWQRGKLPPLRQPSGAVTPRTALLAAVAAAFVVQQGVASARRIEIEPVLTPLPMYDRTWASRGDFDRDQRERFTRYFIADEAGRNVEARLSPIGRAREAVVAAAGALDRGEALHAPHQRRLAAVGHAYLEHWGEPPPPIDVTLERRRFDWTRGRFVDGENPPVKVLVDLAAGVETVAEARP